MTPAVAARIRIAVVLLVALVVQTTLGADLRVLGVAPDLLLLLAICAGLTGGPEAGALTGFAAGMLADVALTTTPLGLSALSWCIVGWGVGSLRANVLPESRSILPVVAFVATGGGVVVFLLFGDLVGQHQLIAYGRSYLVRAALIEAVWSAVLIVPVAFVFGRAARGTPGADALARPDALASR